jgi:hypothetical protein
MKPDRCDIQSLSSGIRSSKRADDTGGATPSQRPLARMQSGIPLGRVSAGGAVVGLRSRGISVPSLLFCASDGSLRRNLLCVPHYQEEN